MAPFTFFLVIAAAAVLPAQALNPGNLAPVAASELAQLKVKTLLNGNAAALAEIPPAQTSTYTNWFSRMGNSILSFIFGIVIIVFSFPVLWMNERRNARLESLLVRAEHECTSYQSLTPDADRRGELVHLAGGNLHGLGAVRDARFPNINFETGCLKLKSRAEVFQWVEHTNTEEKKDMVGGGVTKVTTYSYSQEWSSSAIDSSSFNNRSKQNHVALPGMELGTKLEQNICVEYDGGFVVPSDLVSQMSNFKDLSATLGKSITDQSGKAFKMGDAGLWYYYPLRQAGAAPQIGDTRVDFEYIPDGPASIMALQIEEKGKESFLPFRQIYLGLCGISQEEQKRRQILEGKKDATELAEKDSCQCGPFNWLLCCCIGPCNLVNLLCAGLLTPQVYHLFPGNVDKDAALQIIAFQSKAMKWICRIIGWGMLFGGCYMLFSPLFVALDIVPLLGPSLGSLASFVIWIVCFLATLAISSLVIAVAYLIYRPMLGLAYLAFAATMAAIPLVLLPLLTHSK